MQMTDQQMRQTWMILLALGAVILAVSFVQCSSMSVDMIERYDEREQAKATPVPTPVYLTSRAIEIQRGLLAKSQRKQYDQDIVGEAIQFQGRVRKVYPNGDVTLYDSSGSLHAIWLIGVPSDVVLTLKKDTPLAGMGIIADVGPGFLGLGIDLDVHVMILLES